MPEVLFEFPIILLMFIWRPNTKWVGPVRVNVAMKLTRRNALIGLGTAAAGAGVIGGTGAFTSVEADREVEISTTGDSSANVQLTVDPLGKHGAGLNDDSDNTVQINFDSLNQNATTDYDDALGVTPNTGSAGSYDVAASIVNGNGNSVDMVSVSVDNGAGITAGTEAYVDIEINLQDNNPGDFPNNAVIEISVEQAN